MSVKGCSYVFPSLPSVTKSPRWRKKNVDQFGVMDAGFRVKKQVKRLVLYIQAILPFIDNKSKDGLTRKGKTQRGCREQARLACLPSTAG